MLPLILPAALAMQPAPLIVPPDRPRLMVPAQPRVIMPDPLSLAPALGMIPFPSGMVVGASGPQLLADPPFNTTKLLLGGDGTNGATIFPDLSSANRGSGNLDGTPTVDTSQKAFGTGSMLCDSSRTEGLRFADSADWTLGTAGFIMEVFARHAANNVQETLLAHYNSNSNQRGWRFEYNGAGVLYFAASADGTAFPTVISGTWTPTINTWYYYRLGRTGNEFRLFAGPLGGVATRLATVTNTVNIFNSTASLTVGKQNNSTGSNTCFYGHIDETRIALSNDNATNASFLVPIAAFPRS